MSAPIDVQLRSYTEFFDSELPSVDLEEALNEHVGTALVRPIRPRQRDRARRWRVAVTAAVATLVLIGGLGLLTRVQNTSDAPPVVDQAELASSTVPEDIPTEGWIQVPSWPGPSPTWISAYPSGGFVAGRLNAPALFSTDGMSWTSEPFDQALSGYRDQYIKGRFALANSITGDSSNRDAQWVPGRLGWPSSIGWEVLLEYVDGSWKVWDVGMPVLEPPVQYGNITLVYPQGPNGTEPNVYLVTIDGVTFERHTMPSFASEAVRPEFFTHPGGFGVYQQTRRLYVSDDGVTWSRVDEPDFVPSFSGGPNNVRFFDYGDQVVGQPWSDALLWTSPNGQEWTSSPEPEDPWPETRRTLLKTSSGLVLTATPWELPDLAIWFSEDGGEWTPIDGPPRDAEGQGAPVISVAEDTIFYLPPIGEDGATWARKIP